MVRSTCLLVALFIISTMARAQDHIAIRVNQSGVLKVMELALKYNQNGRGDVGFKIPAGLYTFKIPAEQLTANPIVQILNEISDINLNRDLPFYVYNSEIKVDGQVDKNSLKTAISNYTEKGFNLKISFKITSLKLSVGDISLCEDKSGKKCGNGLKATFKKVTLNTDPSSSITVTGNFKIDLRSNKAKVKMTSMTSTLLGRYAPKLNLNFESLVIPPIAVVINGQRAELDTSELRTKILEKKDFLASKLLTFAGEFVGGDFVEMLNKYLTNESVPTRFRLVDYVRPTNLGEPINDYRDLYPAFPADNTRVVMPRPVLPLLPREPIPSNGGGAQEDNSLIGMLRHDLEQIIRSAQVELSLKSISTPNDKDIELKAKSSVSLNGHTMIPGNSGCKSGTLAALNVGSRINRSEHAALVLSEDLINGALALTGKVDLFNAALVAADADPGFSIKNVCMHFETGAKAADDRIYLIANAEVDLRKVRMNRFRRWIATFLERNNNRARIYFPLQIEIIPKVVATSNGGVSLKIKTDSPFALNEALRNSYGYASNVDNMTNTVRDGLIESLQDNFKDIVNKEFTVPLDSYLNQGGFVYKPRSIKIMDSSYLMISLDLINLDINKLNKK